MSVDDSLALLRIEHKLDLILSALKHQGIALSDLPKLSGYHSDLCPVCEGDVRLSLDVENESYVRSCDCQPHSRLVKGISELTRDPEPPTSPKKEDSHVPASPEQELPAGESRRAHVPVRGS